LMAGEFLQPSDSVSASLSSSVHIMDGSSSASPCCKSLSPSPFAICCSTKCFFFFAPYSFFGCRSSWSCKALLFMLMHAGVFSQDTPHRSPLVHSQPAQK
jgi:hypothetical protein